MKNCVCSLVLLGMVVTSSAQLSYQSVVDLVPTDDAHTYNLAPATNYGSDPTLNIGKVANTPLELYRGHFKFDLTPLGVAPGVAKAELYWYQTSSGAGGIEVFLHALSASWSEGTITWNTNPAFGPQLVSKEVGGASGWYVWDVTCLVRDWAGGVLPNYGLVIKDPETPAGASRPGFGVSKEGAAGRRPYLHVLYNSGYGAAFAAPRGTTESGNVPLTYRLVDPTGGSSMVAASFSTDGGMTFAPAGSGMATGSGLGELRRLVWDSRASGVGLAGPTAVRVRLDFYSREHTPLTEQPYLEVVLGTIPASCNILAPTGGTLSGNVLVNYLAASPASSPATLAARWSTDAGSTWQPAIEGPGGDGTSGLAISPTGVSHDFDWDTGIDIPAGLKLQHE